MVEDIERGVAAIRQHHAGAFPKAALILGSGLGAFAEKLENVTDISYAAIPGFPVPTVAGHAGRLRIGTVAGTSLACLQGRFHAYDGHAPQVLALPIRILKRLGVEILILTNAAGGLRPEMTAGTLMIVEDHINFSGHNPLIGPNDERIGPRFFDMSNAYDAGLRTRLQKAATDAGIAVKSGVYVYCLGPNFETPAEVRMLAGLGADAVGMSTVPECLAAVHCGLKVGAISLITNLAAGLSAGPLTHAETLTEATRAYSQV
ncbi:MAG TPA: purine-nucleoside phosphorylase, partial [Rhizomicrobium sp.]|nr:purine-nucleoside phosphorylase [Rhizomicrobium sp.]